MEFLDVLVNVLALFVGLAVYIIIMKTPFGKKHGDMQFLIMLLAVILAVLAGGAVRETLIKAFPCAKIAMRSIFLCDFLRIPAEHLRKH